MICSTRHRRRVLVPRALGTPRHCFVSTAADCLHLIPLTPPTISETPRQTVMAHPRAAVRVNRAAIISQGTERPG